MSASPSVLYHVAVPSTTRPAWDAVLQEVEKLRPDYGALRTVHLTPGSTPGTNWPRSTWGFTRLGQIRSSERQAQLHHVYNPDPYGFPVLRLLRRPIVYTAVCGWRPEVASRVDPARTPVAAWGLPTPEDAAAAHAAGFARAVVVGPEIDRSHFAATPDPPKEGFTLLAASSAWTPEQLVTKGFQALLDLLTRRPHLELRLLWRGEASADLSGLVAERGVGDRVHVCDHLVDVRQELGQAHAAVVLTNSPWIVRAYPQSLVEALAAHRPVVVSDVIPLARKVRETTAGAVVAGVDLASLLAAVDDLQSRYDDACSATGAALEALPPSPSQVYPPLYAELTTGISGP